MAGSITFNEEIKMCYVYIVECKDGTLYTGWTNNIEKRLAEHNQGNGAKYTRSRYPVTLRYLEKAANKPEACKREYYIKHLTRTEKLSIIKNSYVCDECQE
jgi:putative endonuclease